MGMIIISSAGSFGDRQKQFSAMSHGHANAVAEAIEFLSKEMLPHAIANDHKCHDDGVKPEKGFDKSKEGA